MYYDGSDQTNIEMLGFSSKISNDSADSAKLCPFLKIQLEKFHPKNFFFYINSRLMSYTSHLTQYTSLGALIFIDSILQDRNLCDICDINCDRCDINDNVNKNNLYFQTVSILGWAVGLHD